MKLICKAQQNLVLAYREEDNGDFVFVVCRKGMESVIGRKIRIGEKFTIDIDVKEEF